MSLAIVAAATLTEIGFPATPDTETIAGIKAAIFLSASARTYLRQGLSVTVIRTSLLSKFVSIAEGGGGLNSGFAGPACRTCPPPLYPAQPPFRQSEHSLEQAAEIARG